MIKPGESGNKAIHACVRVNVYGSDMYRYVRSMPSFLWCVCVCVCVSCLTLVYKDEYVCEFARGICIHVFKVVWDVTNNVDIIRRYTECGVLTLCPLLRRYR